jgi:hypothetical protein
MLKIIKSFKNFPITECCHGKHRPKTIGNLLSFSTPKLVQETGLDSAQVEIIPGAGHHIYADQHSIFNTIVEKIIQ